MFERSIDMFAYKAQRTILFAFKDITYQEFQSQKEHGILGKEFTALALFGLQDPLKDGIVESI